MKLARLETTLPIESPTRPGRLGRVTVFDASPTLDLDLSEQTGMATITSGDRVVIVGAHVVLLAIPLSARKKGA